MAKKAASGSGTVRQRKDGKWEARFTVGRDPGTGKQIQKSVYGKTQTEVSKKLRQATAAIDDKTYQTPDKTTIGEWLDTWLELYTGNLKERSRILYAGYVNHRIRPSIGALKLCDLDTTAIQRFIKSLEKGERPLSPKTIKNIVTILHKALSQAKADRRIPYNPVEACVLPRVTKPVITPLDSDDMRRFLDAIKGHPNERVFIVDVFTGLRQGEIIGLTWDCIDFAAGTINIYRQLQLIDGDYKFTSLKNDKTRRITPARFVMDTLKEQQRAQKEMRLSKGPLWQGGGFVFTNDIGEHLKRQTIYKQYKDIVTGIGIPTARFHDMRHSYATLCFQSGDDGKTVQENMGHHSAAFTMDVYGHVTAQMKRASAARMDDAIKGILKR